MAYRESVTKRAGSPQAFPAGNLPPARLIYTSVGSWGAELKTYRGEMLLERARDAKRADLADLTTPVGPLHMRVRSVTRYLLSLDEPQDAVIQVLVLLLAP